MEDRESTRYSQRALHYSTLAQLVMVSLFINIANAQTPCSTGASRFVSNFNQRSISNFTWNLTWIRPTCTNDSPKGYTVKVRVRTTDGYYDENCWIVVVQGDVTHTVVGKDTSWTDTCGYMGSGTWIPGSSVFKKGSNTYWFQIYVSSWSYSVVSTSACIRPFSAPHPRRRMVV
jgi:hypothetical protein